MSGGGSSSGRRRVASRAACAAFAGALLSILAAGCGGGSGLVLEHNALLADSPSDSPMPSSSLVPTFRLGGTAARSDASVRVGSDGLTVEVGRHRLGTWRGFLVATEATYPADSVIHVRMSRPLRSVRLASQSGIALLAVQTGASKSLDYVLVAGVISRGQESWLVGYAHGSAAYANTKVLSVMRAPPRPSRSPCAPTAAHA